MHAMKGKMKGKTSRRGVSVATIVAALLLATPMLLFIAPVLAVPSISLSPTSGPPGTSVTVDGSGFPASVSGVVWFDSNNNGALDPGEPHAPVITDAFGDFSVTLVVPDVIAGTYNIRADVPLDGVVDASATFTVPTPSISLTPTSGPPGTSITVVGSNFKLGATVTIFFDVDGDGVVDPGETVGTATASSTGAFSTVVPAPTLPSGIYNVRATDGVNTAPAVTFTITPAISLSPTSGPPGTTVTVSGSGFAASVSGVVWFDSNNNAALDPGEPSASVTTGPLGTFTATLTVPTVAAGTYNIYADVPSGGPVEASATFTVPTPSISLTPTSGPPGTSITVTGSGFNIGASGFVWFDIDNDGVLDPGEPFVSVTASATGTFTATLTVPIVPFQAAGYNIRADVPSGGPIEASATFLVTPAISLSPTSGPPGTTVTVSGSGFAASVSGVVWFDSNNNAALDPGEPSASVTTGPLGTFTATLTVPTVAAGTYNIYADVPSGGPVEASATFTVLIPSITVSPTTVSSGQLITIAGTDFTPLASGVVWFDIDGDGVPDPGEPQVTVTVSSGGTFITTLTTPDVPAGTYNIRADIPPGPPLEASAPIVVAAPGFAALMAAIQDIEAKLDPGGAFYTFVNNWFTIINNKLGTFTGTDTVASLLYAIEAKLDDASRWVSDADLSAAVSTITSAISEVSAKLGTFGPGETVKSLLDGIRTAVDGVSAKLGTFTGTDTVASLLYQIRAAVTALDLTPVRAGDVVSSRAGTNIAVTSASPYVIGGLPANKAFRGTLTIEIDTTLGSGVFLAVEVWDGDSWARVWRSASNAPAGTAVSIDIAGLTDGTGNAVRIVTNAATPRQFDYVFVYHIDLG